MPCTMRCVISVSIFHTQCAFGSQGVPTICWLTSWNGSRATSLGALHKCTQLIRKHPIRQLVAGNDTRTVTRRAALSHTHGTEQPHITTRFTQPMCNYLTLPAQACEVLTR